MIWGSTYLFVAYAIEEITPFLMIACRFLLGSLVLSALVLVLGKFNNVSRRQWKNASIAGFLFLTIGMGGVVWAIQFLDTGFVALIIASQPINILFLKWLFYKERPSSKAWLGMLLGMVGIVLLVSQKEIVVDWNQWMSILLIVVSIFAWGGGSLFVGKADMPKPQMVNNSIQMFVGGGLLLALSFLAESSWQFDWSSVSIQGWSSLAYLVIFGSVIGYTAFNYLLAVVEPEKVATNTYVNPVVALFLGWWFRDELVTLQSMIAAAILLCGVFFINTSTTIKPRKS